MHKEYLCLGCMSNKGIVDECPYCGFNLKKHQKSNYALSPGEELLERYIIGKTIGSGGFGITYIAFDKVLEVPMAIKEYLPKSLAIRDHDTTKVRATSEENQGQFTYYMEQFLQEARALAQFNNEPGIVSVQDVIKQNGTIYIVMYYVNGITLEKYVKDKGGKLNYEEALSILMVIMRSLSKVHKKGLIHRDISPDNIYITKDNQVKLLDFGAARYMIADATQNMSVILKPGYAPIEQYSQNSKQGPWTDIYAISAMAYWMLTGVKPQDSLQRLLEDNLESIDVLNSTIPKYAASTIMKGLSIEHTNRIQSLDDYISMLQKNDQTVLLDDRTIQVIQKDKHQKSKFKINRNVAAIIIGIIITLSILFAVFSNIGSKDSGSMQDTSDEQSQSDSSNINQDDIVDESLKHVTEQDNKDNVNQGTEDKADQENFEMVSLAGMDINSAMELLKDYNIKVTKFKEEYNDSIDEGKIIWQIPEAGEQVMKNSEVKVSVSLGQSPTGEEKPEDSNQGNNQNAAEDSETDEKDSFIDVPRYFDSSDKETGEKSNLSN